MQGCQQIFPIMLSSNLPPCTIHSHELQWTNSGTTFCFDYIYICVFILYLHTGQVIVGQHITVGTVTCYGLDGPGIETQGRQPNKCDTSPTNWITECNNWTTLQQYLTKVLSAESQNVTTSQHCSSTWYKSYQLNHWMSQQLHIIRSKYKSKYLSIRLQLQEGKTTVFKWSSFPLHAEGPSFKSWHSNPMPTLECPS